MVIGILTRSGDTLRRQALHIPKERAANVWICGFNGCGDAQALVLADMDGWRPYQKIQISYERFVQKHSEQLAQCSPYCKEIFASLLEYCKTTYYDRP